MAFFKSNENEIANFHFEDKNILIGSVFDDRTLISLKEKMTFQHDKLVKINIESKTNDIMLSIIKNLSNYNEKEVYDLLNSSKKKRSKEETLEMEIDEDGVRSEKEFLNINPKLKTFEDYFIPANIQNLLNQIDQFDYIIITNFTEIICWPYLLKRLKLNNQIFNGVIFTTEPISQIARSYLKEFYFTFNLITHNLENKSSLDINNEDKYNQVYINELDINSFIDNLTLLNYNQKIFIHPHLSFKLLSSGFSLGSSNVYFEYYNKNIGVITKSSLISYRYPKPFDVDIFKDLEALIIFPYLSESFINSTDEYANETTNFIELLYKLNSKNDINTMNYVKTFIPIEPLFILDVIDLFRFKLQKEIKILYFSKFIKAVKEYANISHAFLNPFIHSKIYERVMPFNFDELEKRGNT